MSIKKRRAIFLLGLVLVAAIAVATPFLFSRGPRISQQQFDRLKAGMTVEEVSAILGAPPGDFTDGKGYYAHVFGGYHVESIRQNSDKSYKSWCGHDGVIEIWLDGQGRLRGKDFWLPMNPPTTIWDRIKGWLSIGRAE